MLQNAGVLYILPCKCASRHSGVTFLDIGTSKSGPRVWCFARFDLKMCFAPQRRAIFLDRKFKNGSALRCFVHFDLQMFFAPQRRAIFGHRNFKKCSDTVSFLAFSLPNALFATAARHFSPVCWTATSDLARLLFQHHEPRIIEKTQQFATSLIFRARVASF